MIRSTRRLRRVLAVALTIAAGVALAGLGCADRLILPPAQHARPRGGVTRREFPNGAGGVIEAFVARSPGATGATTQPAAYVLRFTGGDAAAAAPFTASRWKNRPVEVWVVNYPGYGGSAEPRSLASLARASTRAYDELREVAGDRPIVVEGFSLGTVPALHVAASRPVAGVILQNPPPLRQVILGVHGWWNLWLIATPVALSVPRDFDSVANARKSGVPAIFLIAERDGTVPLKYQQKIIAAYTGPNRVILQHGADHVAPLNAEDEQTLQDGMDWLLKLAAP
jgi:pimeloyl-ACP methyl ester carboxylesterase